MSFVGLTGNMGSGKSAALRLFHTLGATVLSADQLVSEALEKSWVIQKIHRLFGDNAIDKNGKIDKKALATIIFNDSEKRKSIESLLHPLVFEEAGTAYQAIQLQSPNAIMIFEVPLLFEGRFEHQFDKIIVVYCELDVSLARLVARGFSAEESVQRLKAQMPIEEKIKKADYLINNSFDLKNMERQVQTIYQLLQARQIG